MSKASSATRLLLTPGEPAGIGPDISLNVAGLDIDCELVCIADPELLAARAAQLGISVELITIDSLSDDDIRHQAGRLYVLPVSMAASSEAGVLDPRNSQYVLDCLTVATRHCLDDANSALVTGPVHKGIINEAGIAFTGHTEFLAELSHSTPVMMLATQSLRVALATTHLPLREVSDSISRESLERIIHILSDFLVQRCSIQHPHILVCGLNPHAGEDGHLGMEDIEIIAPAIESSRRQGIDAEGPVPADTAFTGLYLERSDAVLAMYHDQGLPVLKYSGFGHAVNITLGLPFVRTSVDHGTALELAGTGKADASSLIEAINMALEYCKR